MVVLSWPQHYKKKKNTYKKKLHSLWDCCRPWFHIEIRCYVSLWEKDHTSHLIYCHSEPFPNEFMVSVLSFGSHDPIHPLFITTLSLLWGRWSQSKGRLHPGQVASSSQGPSLMVEAAISSVSCSRTLQHATFQSLADLLYSLSYSRAKLWYDRVCFRAPASRSYVVTSGPQKQDGNQHNSSSPHISGQSSLN